MYGMRPEFTITLAFNSSMTHVLMCHHKKFGKLNFLGGHINPKESSMDASYRELEEESGITRNDINLKFVREEYVESAASGSFSLYITAGVINKEIQVISEVNPLEWIDINDTDKFLNAMGYGNCYNFLMESLEVLK